MPKRNPQIVSKMREQIRASKSDSKSEHASPEIWTLKFGKHQGMRLNEVPHRYLKWLVSEKILWRKDLHEYAKKLRDVGDPEVSFFGYRVMIDPNELGAEKKLDRMMADGFAVSGWIMKSVEDGRMRLIMRQAKTDIMTT